MWPCGILHKTKMIGRALGGWRLRQGSTGGAFMSPKNEQSCVLLVMGNLWRVFNKKGLCLEMSFQRSLRLEDVLKKAKPS